MSRAAAVTSPAEHHGRFDGNVARTIAGAVQRSPAFAERLAAAGRTAADLDTVAALDELPIMSKDELLGLQLSEPPFGGLLDPATRPLRLFQSPGPLYEPQLRTGDAWRWAPALRAAGFDEDDVVLIAFGFHLSPAGAMFEAACHALGATVLPAGTGSKDLQVRACHDLGVSAYIGPPSYLKALLDAADSPPAIARAFVTAEPLPPSLRAWLGERVGTVRQGYGTAETGNLGWECDAADGLHVPDDALVQICDLTTGAARHDDGQGQIVVTLFDDAYPVVRFGTGDLSAWFHEPCTCDTPTPRIRGWLGRVGDAVKVKGMFLHPRQVHEVLTGLADVAAYRVVVDRIEHKDVLSCDIVVANGGSAVASAAALRVADDVATALRESLRFNAQVQLVERLDEPASFEDVRTWE